MNGIKFTVYTAAGALIWIVVLTALGYLIEGNQVLINKYLKDITVITVMIVGLIILSYVILNKNKRYSE